MENEDKRGRVEWAAGDLKSAREFGAENTEKVNVITGTYIYDGREKI